MCGNINYQVSVEDGNKLLGYGYSQDFGWINFSPNFGGTTISKDNQIFGWAWSEKMGWILFDGEKIQSAAALADLANNSVASLSGGNANIADFLKYFCSQIYGANNPRCVLTSGAIGL